MSHFLAEAGKARDTRAVEFSGRHYETGTLANALAAMGATDPHTGRPYSEALALGASGGIACGYFVFEYTGHLPHVALLTRNTFAPFERALDNLAIRRETRETTHADKGEKNLRLELDAGNVAIVWADMFSMPYRGLDPQQMWMMLPVLVVGLERDDFILMDGSRQPIRVSAADLDRARGRVKKDRYRMMVLEKPDPERLPEGLKRGIQTCTALYLDKPPAGSANNFGIAALRHLAKMLTDVKNAKGWARTFAPGPRLTQALAGKVGQPGVWDWIETWGTNPGADRGTYADFLREASVWLAEPKLNAIADAFDQSRALWTELAEAAMPDTIAEFAKLKALKRRHSDLWFENGAPTVEERQTIRGEMRELTEALAAPEKLAEASHIQSRMAGIVTRIADLEEGAVRELRAAIG